MMYQCVHCGATFSTRDPKENRCFQCRAENCNPGETAHQQAAEAAFDVWSSQSWGRTSASVANIDGIRAAFLAGWTAKGASDAKP